MGAPVQKPHKIRRGTGVLLDTLDAAIRETEALVAKLRQVKAGLLHDLLTCGLDEHGHLRDPVRHPEQFQESSLGTVPKAWTVVTLGQYMTFLTSGSRGWATYYSKEGALFTRIGKTAKIEFPKPNKPQGKKPGSIRENVNPRNYSNLRKWASEEGFSKILGELTHGNPGFLECHL